MGLEELVLTRFKIELQKFVIKNKNTYDNKAL